MRSKWEWIRDACRELGYNEAAGIADEIEKVLKDIYGDTRTIAWMKDYIDVKEEPLSGGRIYVLAGSIKYCIACMEDGCTTCRFRKRGGGCGTDDTLYRQFLEVLEREGGI